MSRTVRDIAYKLRGTCQSLHEVLEYYGMDGMDMDHSFCAELDSIVFECSQCNWWCEISEMADDDEWRCEECAQGDADDD